MDLNAFIIEIIEGGIKGAKEDYSRPEQKQMMEGSIAGFEACRDKSPEELAELLAEANIVVQEKFQEEAEDYWWHRCYSLEIEWVCNCVSACLLNQGLPPIINPTVRGAMRAAEVVGVAEK